VTFELRRRIELYLKRSGTPPTRFGREACRDPHLLKDIRNGRILGDRVAAKITTYLEAHDQ
jgi:hypothetical protein